MPALDSPHFCLLVVQVRSGIVGAVFRKAMSLHPVSTQFFSTGQLTNLFSGVCSLS
jgi:hypothetical protein